MAVLSDCSENCLAHMKIPGKVQKEKISIKDSYHFCSVLKNYSPKISEYSWYKRLDAFVLVGERKHMKCMPTCAFILFLS